MGRLERAWYEDGWPARLLAPMGTLYCALAGLRRRAYLAGRRPSWRAPVPVVVVGNLTVGGTGKTPLVVWLSERLVHAGFRPGIVSRGYGGSAAAPRWVGPDSDPGQVGDEAVLLAARTARPVVVGRDRPAAVRYLLEHAGCDIVLSDDGLQHYPLQRDVEIAVVDGRRRLGNGRCLPAGPLREPASRLAAADFVVANGPAAAGEVAMRLVGDELCAVGEGGRRRPLHAFAGQRVHAVAGIGHPGRFFDDLRARGFTVVEHAFPDHHRFGPADLEFGDDAPVVMTEKDAVKCRPFARDGQWYLPVQAVLPEDFSERLLARLKGNANG